MKGTNRRSFLKAIGVGAVATALPHAVETSAVAEEQIKSSGSSSKASLVSQVNILQGTNSTRLFSRGNTLPIVALPFGMAHWTLESASDSPWFFHPEDRRIQGIRSTHQLSPWLSDYGQATFMPVDDAARPESGPRSSSYRPEDAVLSPASLAIELLRYRAHVQLAPTLRGAFLQVTFAQLSGSEAGFAIQLPGLDAEATLDRASGTVHCSTSATAGGTPHNFRTYYVVQFGGPGETPVTRLEEHAGKSDRVFIARYNAKAGVAMPIRIATSFISYQQALLNLKTELQSHSFDEVKEAAELTWNEHLGRAIVEGGTAEQRSVFYSAMYRALLFPRTWHELDEQKKPVHFSAFNGKVETGVMYADHGYWDVYRAWYPWLSILFPERLGEILQAWVNAAREGGGWLPQFPSPGYRACMTGSLIDAVFADAAVKQIKGFDLNSAYAALKRHATMPGAPDRGYGRRGIESYLRLGYCPEGVVDQSAAETVDAAYGDFCIAQIAKILGHEQDAAMFSKRSQNWRHLFDAETGFLRGKKEDGSWVEPFNPVRWGSPYVEGAAWQHRWDVPHDPEALFEAIGGKAKAVDQLEKMLSMEPTFDVGAYGAEIHEMSEMAAVPFGQYAHSNQPVHHILYLFVLAGRPDRTQYWVRRVLEELYTPEKFAGDEDTGSMSAWFLLSASGFYPVCPGKAEYVLGAPLFDKVTLTLPQEKRLVITAKGNNSGTPFVESIQWNGKTQAGTTISHADLMRGGSLEFKMSSTASSKRSIS